MDNADWRRYRRKVTVARKHIGAICAAIGMPWRPGSISYGRYLPWDGEVLHGMYLALRRGRRMHPCSDLYHEIAHWLTTPRQYRHYIGFGAGLAPDWMGKNDGPTIALMVNSETVASALGILLQWTHDPDEAMEVAQAQDWDDHVILGVRGEITGYDTRRLLDRLWYEMENDDQKLGRLGLLRLRRAGIDLHKLLER